MYSKYPNNNRHSRGYGRQNSGQFGYGQPGFGRSGGRQDMPGQSMPGQYAPEVPVTEYTSALPIEAPAQNREVPQPVKQRTEEKLPQKPAEEAPLCPSCGKLRGKTALVTGGDNEIGTGIALAYAKEGANVAISFASGLQEAKELKKEVEAFGAKCILLQGDIKSEKVCGQVVAHTVEVFGEINILANNMSVLDVKRDFLDIGREQFLSVIETNVYPIFYLTQAAIKHMNAGASIINTAVSVRFSGSKTTDCQASKGAVIGLTDTFSKTLAEKNIRCNAIVYERTQPGKRLGEKVMVFANAETPADKTSQPFEAAPAIYLASDDSLYVTGRTVQIDLD